MTAFSDFRGNLTFLSVANVPGKNGTRPRGIFYVKRHFLDDTIRVIILEIAK
jgi:hypothetical protein